VEVQVLSTAPFTIRSARNGRTGRARSVASELHVVAKTTVRVQNCATRLIRSEFAFGLQPILQFIARLFPVLQINLVCATPYFLLAWGVQ
jgi:hypothetical protein